MEDEFIKKLKEKYEKGDISKEVYEDILRRYLDEKEKVQEESEKSYVGSEEGVDNGADRAMEDAMKSASSAMMDVEMETKMENRSYKCAGSCTLPPGVYDYISVAGSLKVEGDIVAKKISVAGSLDGKGNIKSDYFKCAGASSFKGKLEGDRIIIAGAFKGEGIRGDSIKISGSVVTDWIEGDQVYLAGYIQCNSIKADEIKIKVEKNSEVKSIEGDSVEIKGEKGILFGCKGKLKAERIVGDNVYLECANAGYVEGDKVVVGNGCNIGTLKAHRVKVNKNSKVKEVIRK